MGRRQGNASGRRTRARAFYDSYMSSPQWWTFRQDWYAWAKNQGEVVCLGCRRAWSLRDDLHHITYTRLTREAFGDLWPLCRGCHEYVHSVIDRPGWRVSRTQAHQVALRVLRAYYGSEHQ